MPGYELASKAPRKVRKAYTCLMFVAIAIRPVNTPHPISKQGSQIDGRTHVMAI